MKESELISLYNKRRRYFLEEILRKQNLAKQDLSGASLVGVISER